MIDWKAAWLAAAPPAPETPALKRLRMRSMLSCMAAAGLVAGTQVLRAVHPYAVLLVVFAMIYAVVITWRYWRVKARADQAYADAKRAARIDPKDALR